MAPKSTPAQTRPWLEALEDRALLSTCTVTRLGDLGIGQGERGDLRYCLNFANHNSGPDGIDFAVQGTIQLKSKLPELATDITMTGPGADLLRVKGGPPRVYTRIFTVTASGVVSISGLTIANGYANYLGGGILNYGSLMLSECSVNSNFADGGSADAHGGGI